MLQHHPDSSARELPSDVTKFLHLSLKKEISDLSIDAKEELGIKTKKDDLLDKVKTMTKDELVKFLETDTTILK
jgi:hypothetical protein